MSVVSKNIVANYTGSIWSTVMGLVFIPLYIKLIGIEAYGLIGVFTTLQSIIVVLDMGFGATLTREIARLSVIPGKAQDIRDMARTLEIIYWAIAILIGVTVMVVSTIISEHWLRPEKFSTDYVRWSIIFMGLAMAVQWPAALYSGGLIGLQRQIPLNCINMLISVFRGPGTVLVLWLTNPTIHTFFIWQTLVNVLNSTLLYGYFWRSLANKGRRPVFRIDILKEIWRFASGVTGITALSLILMYLDKIILSRLLTLEMFGYYSLATTVAMVLLRIVSPVVSAVIPRFNQYISLCDMENLKLLYHRSCQFISFLIFPAACIIALFSYELLFLWFRNQEIAQHTYLLVSILVIGTVMNGLMNLPYGLQIAYGWTKLTFYSNLVSVIVLVPLIIIMTKIYGAVGGAFAWVILNGGYVFIVIHFMHMRILRGEKTRWYLEDIGVPFVATLSVASIGRYLMRGSMSEMVMVFWLMTISLLTLTVSAVATTTIRNQLIRFVSRLRVVYDR